ncbi:MAG: MBL fold metallo-hydrolase [Verrucomicrobiota bacterium]
MRIKIWGCRGSLPVSGPKVDRYGGNTTCVEVRDRGRNRIILDAGTGVRNLGKHLLREKGPHKITFLFSHAHWDHLQGFPFFGPAYSPDFEIAICGGPATQQSIRQFLAHQMEPPYFPIAFAQLKANIRYGCHCGSTKCSGNPTHTDGQLCCGSIPLSHPNGGYGFKLMEADRSFVFVPDNEIGFHHEGGPSREEFVRFIAGADLLFHDAQYTEAEYRKTRGWGHSTYQAVVKIALEAGVKRLGLFHHDPDREDVDLDRQVERCRQWIAESGKTMECFACAEGMELTV